MTLKNEFIAKALKKAGVKCCTPDNWTKCWMYPSFFEHKKEAVQAVNDNGGKAARYFATDMCDGIAQGHDGINYSLPHRDAIVNLVEAQADAIFRAASVLIDDFRCDNY